VAFNTVTTADYALKQNYDSKEIMSVFTRDYPTLSRIKKKQNTIGNPQKVPVVTSDGAGVSSDFATAQSTALGVPGSAFLVEMSDIFADVQIDFKLMETAGTGGGKGAFLDWLKTENDSKINGAGRLLSKFLFSNGGGALGRRLSLATQTITLTNSADAVNFWPGQQLVASTGDGSGGSDALKGGTPVTVQSVDRDLGTVTVDAIANITGNANNDYLFLRGTFAGNVSTKAIFKGFSTWFTAAAPTDTLWGVARTGKPELAGYRVPVADQVGGVIQRLRKAAIHGNSAWGATPKDFILHPKQWEQASISLQNQGYRIIDNGTRDVTGTAGYQILELVTAYGVAKIMSDAHADPTTAYLLDLDTMWISHLQSDLIKAVEKDGLRMIPLATSVGFEVRYACYSNLVCNAPWKNGTVPLAAV
jgi:hypothetical protein